MPLVVSPCRRLCEWTAVTGPASAERAHVLSCRGCGSEWEPGQGWTPRQADGSQPAGLAEALRQPAGAAGSADS